MIFALMSPDPAWSMTTDEFWNGEKETLEITRDHSTGSARQLGLFYGQRILNGMHLLALLAGIYLMIFVVEPVAVPNHYLAQHFYGLPWGADRRLHRDRAEYVHQILQRKDIFSNPRDVINGGQFIQNGHTKTLHPFIPKQQHGTSQHKPKNVKPPSVVHHPVFQRKNNSTPLKNISKVRYISAENLHARRNGTQPPKRINESHTKMIHHWSKWIPTRNSSVETSPNIDEGLYWKPSVKITQRSKPDDISTENKVYNLTGSVTSVRLTDVLS